MSSDHQPGMPGVVRSINDRAALELLLDEGPRTRASIGEITKVSRPTASQVVSRLEAAGLIEPTGLVQGNRGPQAITYAARTDVLVGLALDVTPDGVRASLVDARGEVLADVHVAAGPDRTATDDLLRARSAACTAADVPESRVGIAVAGVQAAADLATGDLDLVGDLPGWPHRGARATLEDALGCTVLVENDANLAAIAERDHLTDVPRSFSLLWLGQGVGLGSWAEGALQRGARGAAGEIGYLPVPASLAGLDDSQTFQDLVGGRRVTRLAVESGLVAPDLWSAVAAVAGARGTPAAATLNEELAMRVAAVLQPVVAVTQPGVVVLGGPFGIACGAPLAEATQAHLDRSDYTVTVLASAVPDAPVLRGARSVAAAEVRAQLLALV
ncbi:putative NBD/HSP70 family sugar kinase [Sediminihabitans luteus]|uniref:Putative NBD/HSP70 family sugar kinase n=1 Tax=Sediminihabitans luteus TaxID=1138585 RepID=A0A2M9CPF6_9CELL|nr:ROK family transcriptional regulator [Sediminihabitans luteus]PJJ73763.1 putative NBD/HSP70 family sugar kinase [Sediminihabitans luteus]GIJ00532.1 hypothetical protein Slu03_29090 [Sediminihabitans luteus]